MAARIGARGKAGKRPPVYRTMDDEGRQASGKPKSAEELAADRDKQKQAETIQLLSAVSLLKAAKAETAKAKEPYDAAKQRERDIKLDAKKAGFHAYELEDLIKDSQVSERKNVTEAEERRYRFRLAMGLPVGRSDEQRELDERLPDVEREGAFWFSAGYTAGISGDKSDAPEPCVRAGHDNRFIEGVKAGQAVLMTRTLAKAAPKSALEPEETPAQKRKREAAEVAKAKEGLAALPPAPADDEPPATPEPPALDPVQEAVKAATPDTTDEAKADDFAEATPEELAAQTTRVAVQAVREADAEAEGV